MLSSYSIGKRHERGSQTDRFVVACRALRGTLLRPGLQPGRKRPLGTSNSAEVWFHPQQAGVINRVE